MTLCEEILFRGIQQAAEFAWYLSIPISFAPLHHNTLD